MTVGTRWGGFTRGTSSKLGSRTDCAHRRELEGEPRTSESGLQRFSSKRSARPSRIGRVTTTNINLQIAPNIVSGTRLLGGTFISLAVRVRLGRFLDGGADFGASSLRVTAEVGKDTSAGRDLYRQARTGAGMKRAIGVRRRALRGLLGPLGERLYS